jgi:type IV secretion system protein VirB6
MALACPAPSSDIGLVQGLLFSVDCNTQGIVESAYSVLATPGGVVSLALTSALTIYVALLGLQLMLGRAPLNIGELTMTLLKIGVVLMLATSWPTYQQLVFDTLFRGPEQLAGSMLAALQPENSVFRGNPFDGLQLAYDQLQRAGAFYAGKAAPTASPFTGGPAFAAFALNLAAILLEMSTLGVILTSKIVLAILLGLGPIFAGFLLFDSTRGIFAGWLRAAIAFALAPLLAIIALVVQLTLIEPLLIRMIELRGQGIVDLAPPMAAFMLTLITTGVAFAALLAVGLIAVGLRFSSSRDSRMGGGEARAANPAAVDRPAAPTSMRPAQLELPARAQQVAAAAAQMERRDIRLQESPAARRLDISPRTDRAAETARVQPLGQSYRRSAAPRRAASSARRDR